MTLDEIRACLEKDGWPIEILSPSTMRSRFRGTDRVFRLFVHLEESFVILAVTGVATLWMAVLADTGASALVVANAVRLRRFT